MDGIGEVGIVELCKWLSVLENSMNTIREGSGEGGSLKGWVGD